jgi:hypothetical protein
LGLSTSCVSNQKYNELKKAYEEELASRDTIKKDTVQLYSTADLDSLVKILQSRNNTNKIVYYDLGKVSPTRFSRYYSINKNLTEHIFSNNLSTYNSCSSLLSNCTTSNWGHGNSICNHGIGNSSFVQANYSPQSIGVGTGFRSNLERGENSNKNPHGSTQIHVINRLEDLANKKVIPLEYSTAKSVDQQGSLRPLQLQTSETNPTEEIEKQTKKLDQLLLEIKKAEQRLRELNSAIRQQEKTNKDKN